ncbi:FtsW/RodA/SpoVE family cell cycle protein [Candidatus Cloacimonadota bacterium]
MENKKIIAKYDYYILTLYIVLMIFGLIMQLNISSVRTSMMFFYKQALWFILSFLTVWFAFKVVDLQKLRKFIFLFVLLTIILLVLVLIIGDTVKGGTRSIRILGINIQPSLIARVVLVLYFAHILDKKKKEIPLTTPRGFITRFSALVIIPGLIFFLILIEKHFTPLIISSLTIISTLFLAKIRLSTIAIIILIIAIAGIGVVKLGPKYRGERMDIYAKYSLFHKNLGIDEEYEGKKDYQIRESLISLASGKIIGTGPKRGTGKHYFLPEAKTDYVFAIIGEEFGFLGALLVVALFTLLFTRSFVNGARSESLYIRLVAYGLGMNIFFNAMVNIGVAMSALPSTGVTLPFISYGGTSLLINSFAIGLILNTSAIRRRI